VVTKNQQLATGSYTRLQEALGVLIIVSHVRELDWFGKLHHQGGLMNELFLVVREIRMHSGVIGDSFALVPLAQHCAPNKDRAYQIFPHIPAHMNQAVGNPIGQELADAAFQAQVIELLPAILADGARASHFHRGTLGVELIDLFFAAQTER
jgi:hypothetical protein